MLFSAALCYSLARLYHTDHISRLPSPSRCVDLGLNLDSIKIKIN